MSDYNEAPTEPLNETKETENIKMDNQNSSERNVRSITSFVLGICSIALWFIPFIGGASSIAGLTLGLIGNRKENKKGLSITGFILSCVGLIFSVFALLFILYVWDKYNISLQV